MTTLHTPLTTDDDGTIIDARGCEIADLWVIDAQGKMRVSDANEAAMRERAAEIVRRCNVHEGLLDALWIAFNHIDRDTHGNDHALVAAVLAKSEAR